MAIKTNTSINGNNYYKIQKVVGHKISKAGYEIPVKKTFYGKNKKEAESKFNEYMQKRALNLDGSRQYFGIMADRWLYEFLANDNNLKHSTKNLYISL